MPPLTPEEQAAMLRAFIGTGSGSNQINDLENLFGFSQNLLAQAAIGMPGVDAQYISDTVQQLAYTPYDGPDPLVIQEQVNEAMRRVASRLGIQPETMNSIAESVIDGIAPDVALAAISGLVFRDAEGNPRPDVSDTERDEFNSLSGILEAYQDAVEAERNTFEMDGQRYVARDETAVRADMEELGLTGPFNDPNIWLFQPDQALAAASQATEAEAATVGRETDALRDRLGRVGRETAQQAARGVQGQEDIERGIIDFFNRSVTPPTVEQGASVAGARIPEGATVSAPRPPVNAPQTDDLAMLQRLAPGAPAPGTADPMEQFYRLTGGRNVTSGYGGADVQPKTLPDQLDVLARLAPGVQPSETGPSPLPPVQQEALDRQREAAIQSANRYATFAAVEQANKGVPLAEENLRREINDSVVRQRELSDLARQQAEEAGAKGTIPGAAQLDIYRDFLTSSFPTVTSGGGGGRQRYRLSQDQIRSVARAAAGPLRRGAQ